jgi:hypothetical protein
MNNLGLILLVFAFVVAAVASRIQSIGAFHLGWLALALYFASLLFGAAHL